MSEQEAAGAAPDLLAWFEDLVKEYPDAEKFRPNVHAVRAAAHEAFAAVDAQMQHAAGQVREAEAQMQRADAFMQEKLKRYLVEVMTTAFDKGMTYTTAMLSIGYVGLFTAWAQSDNDIPAALSRVIIITALISLSTFVLFEVFKMIYGNVLTLRTLALVKHQGDEFDHELHQYVNATSKRQAIFYGVWIATILLTLAFGVISAGVLIYAHIERLFAPALP